MSTEAETFPQTAVTTFHNSSTNQNLNNKSFQANTSFNGQNNGNASFRDDQVHDLMSSIQNKLSMLVC